MHNGLHKYSISRLYKSTVIIFIETLSQSLLYGSHEAPEHCSEQSGCCAMPLQGVSAPLLITVMSPRLFPGSSGKWFPAGSPSQGKAVLGGWRLNGRSQVFLPPSCPPGRACLPCAPVPTWRPSLLRPWAARLLGQVAALSPRIMAPVCSCSLPDTFLMGPPFSFPLGGAPFFLLDLNYIVRASLSYWTW